MSCWKDEARTLLALGAQHESHTTTLFVMAMEGVTAGAGANIDHAVSLLPPSCRGLANGILCDARASGLNDSQIASQLCDLADPPSSSSFHTDHGYSDGMAGNPF